MQHPFRGMNELTTDRGRCHLKGGDVGLVICVEFISQSNLKPACSKKNKKKLLKYPICVTLPILAGKGA